MASLVPLPSYSPSRLSGYIPREKGIEDYIVQIIGQTVASMASTAASQFVQDVMPTKTEKLRRKQLQQSIANSELDYDNTKAQVDEWLANKDYRESQQKLNEQIARQQLENTRGSAQKAKNELQGYDTIKTRETNEYLKNWLDNHPLSETLKQEDRSGILAFGSDLAADYPEDITDPRFEQEMNSFLNEVVKSYRHKETPKGDTGAKSYVVEPSPDTYNFPAAAIPQDKVYQHPSMKKDPLQPPVPPFDMMGWDQILNPNRR